MKYVELIEKTRKALESFGVHFSFHILPDGTIISLGLHDQIISLDPSKVSEIKVSSYCVTIFCKSGSSVSIYSSYVAVML